MQNKNNPAFIKKTTEGLNASYGLTKLEYFTALAMQGLLSNQNIRLQSDMSEIAESLSEDSVLFAQKTLERLEKID